MKTIYIWEIGKWPSLEEAEAGVRVDIYYDRCEVFVVDPHGRPSRWVLTPGTPDREKSDVSSIYAPKKI